MLQSNTRKRHNRHTAIAIANADAAHSYRLAAASAALVESLGIPNVKPSEYKSLSHSYTGMAESHEQQKEAHKQEANASANASGRRKIIEEIQVERAKARALSSENAADRRSDEMWRIILSLSTSLMVRSV